MIVRSLCALVLLLAGGAVLARDWQMQSGSIRFRGTQQGEAFEGEFKRFTPTIHFDPGQADQARFEVDIDIRSAFSANEERDAAMQADEWFGSERYPSARFTAVKARAQGEHRFLAEAELQIRDRRVKLQFPFEWQSNESGAVLSAKVLLNRLDFDLGLGDWADPDWVGHQVEVDVRVELR